jgi:hypothetical protein
VGWDLNPVDFDSSSSPIEATTVHSCASRNLLLQRRNLVLEFGVACPFSGLRLCCGSQLTVLPDSKPRQEHGQYPYSDKPTLAVHLRPASNISNQVINRLIANRVLFQMLRRLESC